MKPLTQRENQVAEKLSEGKPDKLIAAELGISKGSLRVYIKNLFAKLNAHSRTGVVVAFMSSHK